MLKHPMHWLLAIALMTQSLSLCVAMGSAHAGGLWSTSCTGQPLLLPLPGDSTDDNASGQCLYCSSDSPESPPPINALKPSPNPGARLLATDLAIPAHRRLAACHPARAPPTIH